MAEDLPYGPRLTDEEYQKKIVELHRGLPPLPSKEHDRELRRRELDLAIDHRLGRDFPRVRREALWAVKERVEKQRLRLGIKFLFRRLFGKSIADDAQGLAGYMIEEYAKVLNENEVRDFFGLERGARPTLPVEEDRHRGAPK